VLDDLIRAALNEAAAMCVVPEEVDEHILGRIVQGFEAGSGGTSDE